MRAILAIVLCMWMLPGCRPDDASNQLDAYAAAAATNRLTAASGLISAFKSGQVTADAALTHAFEKLDKGENASSYAGAVLDMIEAVTPSLNTGPEFEIFWRRVGRLAYTAAESAYLAKQVEEAETLMLAGGSRWQNEPYFLRYPDHDALVSLVMTQRGRRGEALRRLESRPELLGAAQEAYEAIRASR